MDRKHLGEDEVDAAANDGAVLVCTTDRSLRRDAASVLRERYPVRTASSETDAVASIDDQVTVLVLDVADDEFSLERIRTARRERDCRFQIAGVVADAPTRRLRDRCDGFVRHPVDDEALETTVRWLHRRGHYDESLGAYYDLAVEYAALRTDPDASETALRSLEGQLRQVRAELDDVGAVLDDEDALDVALDDGDSFP